MRIAMKVTSKNISFVNQHISWWDNANIAKRELEQTVEWNTEDGDDTYIVLRDCKGYEGKAALMDVLTKDEFFARFPEATNIDESGLKNV